MSIFDWVLVPTPIPMPASWVANAANANGRLIGAGLKFTIHTAEDIEHALEKIPVLGPLFHAVYAIETGPFILSSDILSGKNIAQAMMSQLKTQLAAIKEIAPYAQMVISFVPGIGPAASAALSVGLALASGQSITQALIAGVKGAIPGGALVSAAVDMAQAAIERKPVLNVLASGVTGIMTGAGVKLPDAAQKLLDTGLNITTNIANGKKVDDAVLDAAIAQIPNKEAQAAATAAKEIGQGHRVADVILEQGQDAIPGLSDKQRENLRTGLTTGMAIAHGEKLQNILTDTIKNSTVQEKLGNVAGAIMKTDNIAQHAQNLLDTPAAKKGFEIGLALTKNGTGIHTVQQQRGDLPPQEKKGYDAAASLHIGRIFTNHPKSMTPGQAGAFYMTHGMMGNSGNNKASIMKSIAANPSAAVAAKYAEALILHSRLPWYEKVWEYLFTPSSDLIVIPK